MEIGMDLHNRSCPHVIAHLYGLCLYVMAHLYGLCLYGWIQVHRSVGTGTLHVWEQDATGMPLR